MSAFSVTVRTPDCQHSYTAIGADSGAVHEATLDRFGICYIFVKPA